MISDFPSFATSLGFRIAEPILADGKVRRINLRPESRSKTGWYVAYDHGEWATVVFGDWADGAGAIKWSSRPERRMSGTDRIAHKAKVDAAMKAEAEKRAQQTERALRHVARFWRDANLVTSEEPIDHPYLAAKQIDGRHFRTVQRKEKDGTMVVELLAPLRDFQENIVNIQRILPNGSKRFIAGAPVSGSWFRTDPVMPSPNTQGEIVITEGIATAASIRKWVDCICLAAMNAGNLPVVTKWARSRWPDARIIIAADDDRWEKDGTPRLVEKNAGRKKAAEAAEGTRALILFPSFMLVESRGTDWNDLFREEGLDAAKAKWTAGLRLAALDRQVAMMPEHEYSAAKPRLISAYSNAGIPNMGNRMLDQRRRASATINPENTVHGDGEEPPHVVMAAICEHIELWRDQFGVAYATFLHNDVMLNAQIVGRFFSDWLRVQWDAESSPVNPPSQSVIQATVEQNAARARMNAPSYTSFYRMGYDESADMHWWDLGRPDWKMVRFNAEGWEVTTECPIKFAHSESKCEMALPERNPDLDGLTPMWKILNVDPKDYCLIAGFLLGSMLSTAPCFGLSVFGPNGTSKSVTCENLRKMIDHNPASAQTLNEKNVGELGLTCITQWMPIFENMSKLDPEVQDALCSLTTKLSSKTRELYTNTGIIAYEVRRPWMVNGINNVCSRGDLAQRTIPLALLPPPEGDDRKKEEEVHREFALMRPHIMACLLDAAVEACQLKPQAAKFLSKNGYHHRMADALEWITAGEAALGFPTGSFIRRLNQLQEQAGQEALDGHPIVATLESLLANSSRGFWCGSYLSLLTEVHEEFPNAKKDKYMPHDAIGMGNWVTRETERLRKSFGIRVGERRQSRAGGKREWVRDYQKLNIETEAEETNDDPY